MADLKILLVEDHPVVRNGIKLLLDSQPNMEVIADEDNGKGALKLLSQGISTDILVTDLGMVEMDGFELIEVVKKTYPAIKIVVLSMVNDLQTVTSCFAQGASGYLVKNVEAEEMIFCLNHVAKGARYLCQELSISLIEKEIDQHNSTAHSINPLALEMSSREMEILELLGEGYTNLEISKKLFLSKRTVEGHRQNLIDKTKSKNTPALIKFAIKNGLIR